MKITDYWVFLLLISIGTCNTCNNTEALLKEQRKTNEILERLEKNET